MAAAFTVGNKHVPGDKQRLSIMMTFDASYPAGGYPVPTAAQLGLNKITDLQFTNFNAVASTVALAAVDYVVNNTTNKVQLVTIAGIEVAAAVPVNTFSVDAIVEGY